MNFPSLPAPKTTADPTVVRVSEITGPDGVEGKMSMLERKKFFKWFHRRPAKDRVSKPPAPVSVFFGGGWYD
jgi:hypothetical protein